jgi:hypothetical protein
MTKAVLKNQFPAFVGTTAVPKSVALSEEQLSDATLKSVAQTVTGKRTYDADQVMNNTRALTGKTAAAVERSIATITAADLLRMGDVLIDAEMRALASWRVRIGAAADTSLEVVSRALGALLVFSQDGVALKAAFRNPAQQGTVAPSGTLLQASEGQVVGYTGAAGVVFAPTLEAGTAITLQNRGTGEITLTAAGVTLNWFNGGGSLATGTRKVAVNSVVQLWWRSAILVDVWGNGIS